MTDEWRNRIGHQAEQLTPWVENEGDEGDDTTRKREQISMPGSTWRMTDEWRNRIGHEAEQLTSCIEGTRRGRRNREEMRAGQHDGQRLENYQRVAELNWARGRPTHYRGRVVKVFEKISREMGAGRHNWSTQGKRDVRQSKRDSIPQDNDLHSRCSM